MHVLVTGGAGFIGSHVVDALIESGHAVRVLDVLHPAAHRGPPEWRNDRADYRWANLTDLNEVNDAIRHVDAVCHQASMVGLGIDFADVAEYVRHNDLGTATLILALHNSKFAGRIVLASSMVVYGEGRYVCETHGQVKAPPRRVEALERGDYEPACPKCNCALQPEPVPESARLDPRNVYAATKLHQEHLCQAFAREHPGVTVTALRYHNVYGARMPSNTPYAGVASIFRSALDRGEPPRVFEDGGQRRDFVHVRDVARANVLALTADSPYDGPLNIASGSPRSVLDMAIALTNAYGEHIPAPAVVGGYRLGDVRHVFASPELAAETIGFRAQVDFTTGMREFAHAHTRT
jgi:dTDP-L-rhamnose 4-epimerase